MNRFENLSIPAKPQGDREYMAVVIERLYHPRGVRVDFGVDIGQHLFLYPHRTGDDLRFYDHTAGGHHGDGFSALRGKVFYHHTAIL